MRSLSLLCVLLALAAVSVSAIKSQAKTETGDVFLRVNIESDDSNPEAPVQIRVESQNEDDEQPFGGGLFAPLRRFAPFRTHSRSLFLNGGSLLESKPEPFPAFPRLFQHLFKFPEEEQQQQTESPLEMFSFHIEPLFDEEQQNEIPPFSRIFQHMTDMLTQMQASNGMQEQLQRPSKPKRRGGCTLVEVCGEDIEKHCAYAKRLALAHALPRCLSRFQSELSERCHAYMSRRYGSDGMPLTQDEEAQTENHQHVPQPQPEDDDKEEDDEDDDAIIAGTPLTPQEPAPVVAPPAPPAVEVTPANPREVCKASAKSLCPELDLKNVVHVMSCLNRHRAEVPATCLDSIKETTAFNCAPDAEKFCSGMTDRQEIARCLHPHAKELSKECVAAAKKTPAHQRGKMSARFATQAESTDANPEVADDGQYTPLLAIGLSGLVVLVVVGVVVTVVRRRRARLQARYQKVATVQLVNPNFERAAVSAPSESMAVTATAVSYEPRPEEQL